MKKLYLYGIAGADNLYRVIWHSCIDEEHISIENIRYEAACLEHEHPGIEHVYVMDGGGKLAWDYKCAWRKNTMESWVEFKDLLERDGIMVF